MLFHEVVAFGLLQWSQRSHNFALEVVLGPSWSIPCPSQSAHDTSSLPGIVNTPKTSSLFELDSGGTDNALWRFIQSTSQTT